MNMFVPAEIAAQISIELIERVRSQAMDLSADLADLACADPVAFAAKWREGVRQIVAAALHAAHEDAGAWSAPEAAWRVGH